MPGSSSTPSSGGGVPARGRRPRPLPERRVALPMLAAIEIPARTGPEGGGPRRRDRRGRGIRGPLLPPLSPGSRTRAERFDEQVLLAVERLERRWARQLQGTEFAVEDVPPSDPAPWEEGGVPLGRYFPATSGQPPRIVVYRWPVETRAVDAEDLADIVRDVVVEQVAHQLGRAPEEIDPGFGGGF